MCSCNVLDYENTNSQFPLSYLQGVLYQSECGAIVTFGYTSVLRAIVSRCVKMLSRCVVSQVKHNSYFLVGLALGLWLALATVPLEEEGAGCTAPVAASASLDEWEPVREQREMGAPGAPGRSVQRPRYYSTELGMRAGLLAGALTSEAALGGRAAALNRTAARLLPALRFFITASALRSAPAGANVVGFTDTREMLKPFHALKYLADNYLEEYDFFFLVTDTTFVNARRLTDLVSRLSVSQDIYMGTVADDDTQYCSLGKTTIVKLLFQIE